MPIPEAPFSDSDLLGRMQRALTAWSDIARRIARNESVAGANLEAVADAFDALSGMWCHIEDLRREIRRLESEREEASARLEAVCLRPGDRGSAAALEVHDAVRRNAYGLPEATEEPTEESPLDAFEATRASRARATESAMTIGECVECRAPTTEDPLGRLCVRHNDARAVREG